MPWESFFPPRPKHSLRPEEEMRARESLIKKIVQLRALQETEYNVFSLLPGWSS